MVRSLSNINIAGVIGNAISWRGYSMASSVVGGGRSGAAALVKQGEEKKVVKMIQEGETELSASWVPDPVTGYYRPESRVEETDPAELRAMMLNQKVH